MEKATAEPMEAKQILRWNHSLSVVTWLGIGWTIIEMGLALSGHRFRVAYFAGDELVTFGADDFTLGQRMLLTCLGTLPAVCWIAGLWQVAQLSRTFARGEMLTENVVKCLERFSYAMMVLAFAEMVHLPLMIRYLQSLKDAKPPNDFWQLVLSNDPLISVMAAALVMSIARVLHSGIRLREDAELTI